MPGRGDELGFGSVVRLRSDRRARGHEQSGPRYGVVVQNPDVLLSTILVAPTSTSAHHLSFRPRVEVLGASTLVLVDRTSACDLTRLGETVGVLAVDEVREVRAGLRVVLDLDAP